MGIRRDFLHIGDTSDDTVKRFDAVTGRFLGTFVTSGSGGLNGPRGIIFDHIGNLLASNQNVEQPQNGNVLKYSGETGAFLTTISSSKKVRRLRHAVSSSRTTMFCLWQTSRALSTRRNLENCEHIVGQMVTFLAISIMLVSTDRSFLVVSSLVQTVCYMSPSSTLLIH